MITTIGRARCGLCGARLRQGRQRGELCDPCERVGPDPRRALPADFYSREAIVGILAGYDFGAFFIEVRRATGWTQQALAGVVGLTQSQISSIERGERRLRDIELIAGLARALAIPPALLNFPDIGATVGATGVTRLKDVSWVDRRNFGQHIAGLVLGIAGATGLDTGRLLTLLPQAEPTGTRHLGVADVEVIEELTAAFVRQDFARGSGPTRDAAVAQLRSVLPLLDAQVAPELRPRMMIATGHLAMQAGWMSYDSKHHDAARRLWMTGLDLARHTEHPLGADLTAYLLYDMAHQAVYLGRAKEALHLTRVGHTATAGSQPVSAATLFALASAEAWGHALQGDATGCDRALGQAQDHITTIDPSTAPPWSGHLVDDTDLAAHQGAAHYRLALTGQSPPAASRAVPSLRHAVDHFGPAYARAQALYLPDLAGAHALAGDTDTAVTVGHQAVDAVTAVSSPRANDRLRTLHTVLEPIRASPGVADLREQLATTAA